MSKYLLGEQMPKLERRESHAFVSICDKNALVPTLIGIISHAINGCKKPWVIMATGLSAHDIKLISRVEGEFGLSIFVSDIEFSAFKALPTPSEWRNLVWLKLSLAKLAKERFDRIVYVDSDTLALENADPIFEVDLCGKPIAAVASPQDHSWRFSDLGMPENSTYFNAGVLVIDVDCFLRNRIDEKVLQFAVENQHSLGCAEQCALNAGALGHIQRIDDMWNYLVGYSKAIRVRPKILHFAGPLKPWNYANYPAVQYFGIYLKRLKQLSDNLNAYESNDLFSPFSQTATTAETCTNRGLSNERVELKAQVKSFDQKRMIFDAFYSEDLIKIRSNLFVQR